MFRGQNRWRGKKVVGLKKLGENLEGVEENRVCVEKKPRGGDEGGGKVQGRRGSATRGRGAG